MLGGEKEREDCVGGGAEEAGRPEGRLLQYRCEDAGGKKNSLLGKLSWEQRRCFGVSECQTTKTGVPLSLQLAQVS